MFVCLGNICRSPMAEFVLRDMVDKKGIADKFLIRSSATSTEEVGNDIHYGTRQKLTEKGIPFVPRRAVQFTRGDYENYDYILVMEEKNIRGLRRIIGEDKLGKIHRLLDYTSRGGDIADPWYTDRFDIAYRDIYEGCAAMLEKI